MAGLGDRDVVAAAQPVLQASQDGPLLFQGGAAIQVQLPHYNTYDHGNRRLELCVCCSR